MSDFTGPGRNNEMSTIRSSNRMGSSRCSSSRCPGDSIWKHPRVSEARISSKVGSSSSGIPSRSIFSPVVRAISSIAWRIDESIRTPRTSSFR